MSKYKNKRITRDGFTFDSIIESDYYFHLKELQKKGVVKSFELQPKFTLLKGFTDSYGVKHRPIEYKGDFLVNYVDGTTKVIDIKGTILPEFKIKQKLYCSLYPHELVLISYSKTDGGWIRLEDLKVARKGRKKEKEYYDSIMRDLYPKLISIKEYNHDDVLVVIRKHMKEQYDLKVTNNRIEKAVKGTSK